VENKKTGEQYITIHDPNSHRKVTVPTYARGEKPEVKPQLVEITIPQGEMDDSSIPPAATEEVTEKMQTVNLDPNFP
jgi:hypothetical protein